MNHGGVGYIDESRIMLPIDVLRPLSIAEGTFVEGMYYPMPGDVSHSDIENFVDFMLTPIPFRFWPAVAHLVVRLKHHSHTLSEVAKFLRDRDVTILNAECSRSAHRYATWNLTIHFDSLPDDNIYDPTTSEHQGTIRALADLQNAIIAAFAAEDILFYDENDSGLKIPVETIPIRTHSYFYNNMMVRRESPDWDKILDSTFRLSCNNFELNPQDDCLCHIFGSLKDGFGELAPACVFAEMDTRDYNIRTVIIPKQKLPSFFEVHVRYARRSTKSFSDKHTSCGLMAYITDVMPKRYNMWRIYNHTTQNDEHVELGEIVMFIQDMLAPGADTAVCLSNAWDFFMSLESKKIPGELGHVSIENVDVRPVSEQRILQDRFKDLERYGAADPDVFISYGKPDEDRASNLYQKLRSAGVRPYLAKQNIEPGGAWLEDIVSNIKKVSELHVICTKEGLKRKYVTLEIGCAMVRGIKVVPILYGISVEDLPFELRSIQGLVDENELDIYINEVKYRLGK